MSEENLYGNKDRAEYEDKNGNLWMLQAESEGEVKILTGSELPTPTDPNRPEYNAVILSGEKVVRVSCYAEALSEGEVQELRERTTDGQQMDSEAVAANAGGVWEESEEAQTDAGSESNNTGILVTWRLDQTNIDGPLRTHFQIDPDIAANQVDTYTFVLGSGDTLANVQVTTGFGSVVGALNSSDFSVASVSSGVSFSLRGFSITSNQWHVNIRGLEDASYEVTGDFSKF